VLAGIAIAFAGLFRHLHPMVFGEAPAGQSPVHANMMPVYVHLAIVLGLGISIPVVLARWFNEATILITGSSLL
jgi:hydrogenase-4 component F